MNNRIGHHNILDINVIMPYV